MKLLLLLLLIIITGCNNQSKSKNIIQKLSYDTLSNGLQIINRTIDSPYHYKDQVSTVSLFGNYQVVYAQDKTYYYLYLKYLDTLQLLNKTEKFTSLLHLGKVMDDYTSYFILGHDNGNGAPYSYEFIDKPTRKNPLGFGREFSDIKAINKTNYLLYIDTNKNGSTPLILFNTISHQKEHYKLEDANCELLIDTITKTYLTIKYSIDFNRDTIRTKKYQRIN